MIYINCASTAIPLAPPSYDDVAAMTSSAGSGPAGNTASRANDVIAATSEEAGVTAAATGNTMSRVLDVSATTSEEAGVTAVTAAAGNFASRVSDVSAPTSEEAIVTAITAATSR